MSATADVQERENATHAEHAPARFPLTGPASQAQLFLLRKFGCTIPADLTKQAASDWGDWIMGKFRAGTKITPEDLSGPPSFSTAARPPPTPVPVRPPVPETPDSPTATPESVAAPPRPVPGASKEPYVMMSAWVPFDKVDLVARAFKEARGP
ncbi:MAG: hypothetical protein WCB19_05620 [Thermoplasmata archaeon]